MKQHGEARKRESWMRRVRGNARGQALVEFALVISFLLVPMVVGMGALTGYLRTYIALTDAVSVAAQSLAVSRGETLDPCALVVSAVEGAAPYLSTGNFIFNTTLNGTAYTNQTSCSSASFTTGAPAKLVKGSTIVINVQYGPVPYILTSYAPNYKIYAQSTEIVQ
jgi:Flp pilus assembly protein TadG